MAFVVSIFENKTEKRRIFGPPDTSQLSLRADLLCQRKLVEAVDDDEDDEV
jgi:hypothetical protein